MSKSEWDNGQDFVQTGRKVRWTEVAKKVCDIQRRPVSRIPELNFSELETGIRQRWGVS